MTAKAMSAPAHNDAELVHECLAGNREAFGVIVARYQSLICSLAYSATGSLSRSEDLSQDTFVTAWKQLPELREPARLRSWLCGIARNLISNAQRRAGREPVQFAEPFGPAHEGAATEPSPPEEVITREEEAILWRALGQIPEVYREPLVLFYREHQSVAYVAQALDLSEDAVKQRLSRGRVRLQERVLAFVEGTLERSKPGRAFTLGVMAALPVLHTAIATATAGAAATKGTAAAKSATWLGALGAILTAQVLWFVSSFAFVAFIGGYTGWQMSDRARSPGERVWVARFWRLFVAGMFLCILPVCLLPDSTRLHPRLVVAATWWLGSFYAVLAVTLAAWAWRNHRRIRGRDPDEKPARPKPAAADTGWVAVATVGMAALLTWGSASSHWYKRITSSEVRNMIVGHPEAQYHVLQYASGSSWIDVVVPNSAGLSRYRGVLDGAGWSLLKNSGAAYEVRVQGQDFDLLGWPGRRLGLVSILVVAAGAVILVRAAKDGNTGLPAPRSPATPTMQ